MAGICPRTGVFVWVWRSKGPRRPSSIQSRIRTTPRPRATPRITATPTINRRSGLTGEVGNTLCDALRHLRVLVRERDQEQVGIDRDGDRQAVLQLAYRNKQRLRRDRKHG